MGFEMRQIVQLLLTQLQQKVQLNETRTNKYQTYYFDNFKIL